MRKTAIVTGSIIAVALAACTALGQSSPGGHVGSEQWFKSQRDSAIQRGNLERSLGGRDAADGTGREIDLRIVFPRAQRGLGNIMSVLLVPAGAGGHEAAGLASFDKEHDAITTTFVPKKDVQPGTYDVILVDSRGGKLGPVGRITVGPNSRQAFRIDARLIGESPTPASGPAPGATPSKTQESEPPKAGEGYKRPSVGEGYVRPGSR